MHNRISIFCFSTNFCRINTEMCSWVVQTYRFTLGFKFTLEIQGFLFIPGDIPGKGGYYNTIIYINNSQHLARKYARIYLSADIICSEKWTVFQERSSRKTVSYEEQIMSKDINCLYYPLNLYRNACNFQDWGIFLDIFQF